MCLGLSFNSAALMKNIVLKLVVLSYIDSDWKLILQYRMMVSVLNSLRT